ncbi:MAG TPA: acyl-CoA synthetase FdrA [Thermoanaerobaculia bacterium]|jgi:FdrA protein|nr:acyl-CoA synthetase FdrA [Thermoanaerobaculia bacterium]
MSGGPTVRCAVRPGAYYDSVVLMQLQRALTSLPGVIDAGVVMATPANHEILAASGLAPGAEIAAGPHDLLIAVKAESDAAGAEALARVDSLLQVRRGGGEQDFRPRSLASALKLLPEARWVLISVPGRYAAGVADEALDEGRNVFLYSDNVPTEQEVALKRKALEKGLLVMGPDCGTAIIAGTGLGFANRVRRGNIGLIGASGTGLQAVTSHLHYLGAGVSQAIGTGGRDLSAEVGGITARQALDLLGRDPETRVIVLISKPPAPEVAARLLAAAQATGKPVVVDFLGLVPPLRRLGSIHFAVSLTETAELAAGLEPSRFSPSSPGEGGGEGAGEEGRGDEGLGWGRAKAAGFLRGLFAGGTLAYEARLALRTFLPEEGNTILDLGDDEFTVGRLHPMIDQDLRLRRLRQEAADPEVGIILLDVVLGDGAHADPAGELAPVIERVLADRAGTLDILVIVLGTDEDPQNLAEQIATLRRAGAHVYRTVSEAVEAVWQRQARGEELETPIPLESIRPPLAAVNVGLESFYDSLRAQGASAVQVEWKPPAGGNEKLAGILARMKAR